MGGWEGNALGGEWWQVLSDRTRRGEHKRGGLTDVMEAHLGTQSEHVMKAIHTIYSQWEYRSLFKKYRYFLAERREDAEKKGWNTSDTKTPIKAPE